MFWKFVSKNNPFESSTLPCTSKEKNKLKQNFTFFGGKKLEGGTLSEQTGFDFLKRIDPRLSLQE
jgi:hypothetical protein